MTRCLIENENGMLLLSSPYIPELVEAVKSLPYTERKYEPNSKSWLIDPKHGNKLVSWIEIYVGEVVSLPIVSQTSSKPVIKLLEVKYIGACKNRDDGSSSAFGLVGKDWSVIFPEKVLRTWFDAGDQEPSETQTLYQVLGIGKLATPDEIKTAFRRMALQWHPDVSKEPNTAEIFIRIKEASDILSDTNKRARYDAGLILQKQYEKQQKNLDIQTYSAFGYRSPLRCGAIMLEGIEKLGRVEVTKILAWEDITRNGKVLVTSWPAGAKEPVEAWV